MTNPFVPPVIDPSTAMKFAEINFKALTDVADNQNKLFNGLLAASLDRLKAAQSVKNVNEFVEVEKNYTQEVENKLRKAFDANNTVLETAGKKSLDLIVGQQPTTSSSK